MDLSPDTEEYIKESVGNLLGLPVSVKSLSLKLLASEDARHRLQDQIFVLQERLELTKAEANTNALRRWCVDEKEILVSKYEELVNHCFKLEEECSLYERDLERVAESCDELGKEDEELRVRLQETSSAEGAIMALSCSGMILGTQPRSG